MTAAINVDHVYKKFRRGEYHDSLRDLLPAISGRFFRRLVRKGEDLGRQEFWALQDVSFSIGRGEAVGIIGHNGAGKSTLLKHLTGVLSPTRGSLTLAGRVSALIEVGAGFHPLLTGRENVFLNGVILGMSIAEIRRKFDEIVAFSGLDDFIDTPVRRYSSGMFARLGFSVAAHLDPEILLIDEVLSVGDFAFQAKGIAKMKSVVENGTTVLFVSHNLKSVQDLCPRCLLMSNGTLIMDAPTGEVTRRYLEIGRSRPDAGDNADEAARIEDCVLLGPNGPASVIDAGDEIVIEATVRVLQPRRGVDILVRIIDDARYEACNLSLGRLGQDVSSLQSGETLSFRIRGAAHLVSGSYEINVAVRDLAQGRDIVTMTPPVTFYVRAPAEWRGVANIYPQLIGFERST